MRYYVTDSKAEASETPVEVAEVTVEASVKALKKNTTQMDNKQADTKGEAIKGERSAYPNGEHIKMQKIRADPIGKALKKIAEMTERPKC